MIQITANTRRAIVTNKELLTTGSAGIQVRFTLSEDWAGLAKVAVFRQGDDGERVDCVLDSGLTCVVPPEVLTIEDEVVFCGVYGSNGQGSIIIPTIWAALGVVRPGTEPNTPATATPTPEIWAQILNVAQDAEATADEAMSFVEAGLTDLSALEAMVETAEASRVLAEQGRVSAENQRVTAENNRVSAENARVAEENERSAAETARVNAEQNRTTAENARANAEASRVSAEQSRVAAEQDREEKYAEYVQTVTDAADDARASATAAASSASAATTAARDASDSAGQAATSASVAATSASQASNSASNASSSASTATGAATTATTQAGIASTKATEAASSATAAAGSATDAAAAQTAAETAQAAAETAQAAAEDAADSVSASASQIAQNTSDIADLSRQLSDVDQYFYAKRGVWNGAALVPANNVAHVIDIPLNRFRKFKFHYPSTIKYYSLWKEVNGSWSSVSGITDDIYEADSNVENFIVQFVNKTSSNTDITDAELKQIYLSCVNEEIESLETRMEAAEEDIDNLETTVGAIPYRMPPKNTTFFDGVNYFDPLEATVYTDRLFNGIKIISGSPALSLAFKVEPNTTYYFYVPDANRAFVGESTDNSFPIDKTLTALVTSGTYPISFTTSATAKYIFAFCYAGSYDYNNKKNQIVLNIDEYFGNVSPYIPNRYLPQNFRNGLENANILIFGDSITDTCNITINSSNQTIAYAWRNPSNSYTKDGTLIQYSMWPKILKLSEPCGEIRNYALAGASYLTHERESGYERQNVQYQIDVALNDRLNPNNVFDVDDYKPQIIIFALGTNDGVPLDTFESAMSATVYESDGVTINVNATLAALDDTKTIASARKAFLRVKQAFPTAQIYCVLPIERADQDNNWGTLRTYLRQIAERCGCIVIDGTASSGITREFNVFNNVGTYLKDGLHPNDLGQNFMARMIILALKANYCSFSVGFNP